MRARKNVVGRRNAQGNRNTRAEGEGRTSRVLGRPQRRVPMQHEAQHDAEPYGHECVEQALGHVRQELSPARRAEQGSGCEDAHARECPRPPDPRNRKRTDEEPFRQAVGDECETQND